MQPGSFGEITASLVANFLNQFFGYLPQFFAGLLILLVGLVIAAALKRIVIEFFNLIRIDKWLSQAKVAKEKEVRVWPEIIAELTRWGIIILFLVPAAEAWGIPRVTAVLNQLLFYLPNVFVAVIVGLVGVVLGNITNDVVRHGLASLGSDSASAIGAFARYAILFFSGLIVLNQLGVASDLVRILFTGIVAMLAIAGGLAFGLGGQETAREILKGLRKKLEK